MKQQELNDNEIKFFENFHQLLLLNNLNPQFVHQTRLSSGTFNVYYQSYYLGKIHLYCPPPSYAVIKTGNKRPTKIFTSLKDAENFISSKNNYTIITRTPQSTIYMQYVKGLYDVEELHDVSLQDTINALPHWINQIYFCLDDDLALNDIYKDLGL